ncbi:MAG TPA: DNA polymerase III subunit delta [Phycisphaerae bacterium]|nr:DNA polymerase III subunit delta [Phycisphaerae bacterium]
MARKSGGKKSRKGSAAIRLSDFQKPRQADPKPIYVLCGTDPYLLDQGRRTVRTRVFGEADPGMALTEFTGADADLADVLDALRTPPFLAPRRLVAIREADDFVSRHREALEEYLAAVSPCGSLCLEVAAWNESTRLAKRAAEIGAVVLCEATDTRQIPRWLQGEAKQRYGKALTYGAAQMLLDYLGPDFAALLSAIDILALYADSAPAIDTPEVDTLVARGHHERIWDLCDAVAEHRLPRALELLEAFQAEGMAAPQIIGAMRPTFRQLVRIAALNRRMSLDAAMDEARVPSFARSRVRRAVQAFGPHLAEAYQSLVDADLESKTGADERLAMETLVHRLCNPEAARLIESGGWTE